MANRHPLQMMLALLCKIHPKLCTDTISKTTENRTTQRATLYR